MLTGGEKAKGVGPAQPKGDVQFKEESLRVGKHKKPKQPLTPGDLQKDARNLHKTVKGGAAGERGGVLIRDKSLPLVGRYISGSEKFEAVAIVSPDRLDLVKLALDQGLIKVQGRTYGGKLVFCAEGDIDRMQRVLASPGALVRY